MNKFCLLRFSISFPMVSFSEENKFQTTIEICQCEVVGFF